MKQFLLDLDASINGIYLNSETIELLSVIQCKNIEELKKFAQDCSQLDLSEKYFSNWSEQDIENIKKDLFEKYIKKINPNQSIQSQNLKEETLALIAMLNLQYWCENEDEKERLKKIYAQNEKKYQDMIQEKYNIDNIFKKNEEIIENKQEQKNDMQIVVYKNSTLKRIINKILNFLHLR